MAQEPKHLRHGVAPAGFVSREAIPARRIVLIIGGGIAAYKCLDLIRRLRERGIAVRAVMTRAAQEFVTPLSVGALTNDRVFTELFDLNDEREIGHIRLSREADLIVVAPATADLLAKMAGGHADDLASCVLMATDKPVLVAPAMNPRMWLHPATRRNVALLQADGIHFIGPDIGEMAERGEAGPGRLAEVPELVEAIGRLLASPPPCRRRSPRVGEGQDGGIPEPPPEFGRLTARSPAATCSSPAARRTSRSIPCATSPTAPRASRARPSPPRPRRSAPRVTLVTGPTQVAPSGRRRGRQCRDRARDAGRGARSAAGRHRHLRRRRGRLAGCDARRPRRSRRAAKACPVWSWSRTPTSCKTIASDRPGKRPPLVIGFAAETENVVEHARKKRKAKGADWIVANDVSPETGIMGGDRNTVHLITAQGVESWPELDKAQVARRLVARAAEWLAENTAVT